MNGADIQARAISNFLAVCMSCAPVALSMEQLKQLRATLSNNFLQIAEHDHSADSGKVWAMWVMVWVIKRGQIAHA
jgi:hypothetical protein